MVDYELGHGFESDSIAFGFEIIWQSIYPLSGEQLIDFKKMIGCFDVITYRRKHGPICPPSLPRDVFNNPGFEELAFKAYYDHIWPNRDIPSICIRARWAANYDSYKKLKNNIRFLQQYDDEVHGLTLVFYMQSFDEDFKKDAEFCFDFIEHDKIRLLRSME